MNNDAMKEVLNELFSHLEKLETQNEAILQFLKEKKRVTDKQLAPYLENAGNASNVKWRAARVRINHLLEPEHPEKEIKLGKKPELHEGPSTASAAGSSQGEHSEPRDKEGKHTEFRNAEVSGSDLSEKEKPAPAEAVQARPTDGNADKPEEKSDSGAGHAEVAAQVKGDKKPDAEDACHPMEVTQPLAEQQGAEPATQLRPNEKGSDQEAA